MAGLYQFNRRKRICLNHCRSPLGFIMTHDFGSGARPARAGMAHGAFCLGCCMSALIYADWIELGRRWLDRALERARELGSLVGFVVASCYRSNAAYREGRLADAEADALRARMFSTGSRPTTSERRWSSSPSLTPIGTWWSSPLSRGSELCPG